ncbi:MAG TPA: hypothetical protein VNP71_10570 [Thermoplasmata archaeon]|nr:hypothetical protein [Thermoplasmata archaeon]
MARTPKWSSPGRVAMLGLSVLLGIFLGAVTSPSAAAAGPSVSILAPANDQVIGNGTPVIVSFAVANFVLVQPGRVGQVANAGEGHVDVYVDGAYSRLLTHIEPISLPLESGPHTIRLQLVQDNGTPLSPDVSASVRIVATHGPAVGTPTITIVSPKPGPTIAHDVYFAVEVTNFTLVDSYGQPNAPNEGHVQLFLNGVLSQEPRAYDLGFIVDMPDGNNTITARLVNNDNTPLNPDVSASVSIRIQGAADPTGSEQVTGGLSLILALILAVLLVRRRKAARRVSLPNEDT